MRTNWGLNGQTQRAKNKLLMGQKGIDIYFQRTNIGDRTSKCWGGLKGKLLSSNR